MNKLTQKQQDFITNKAAGVTNRDAAIAAGYAVGGAAVAADKLMRNPAVRAAIKAATKDTQPVGMKSGMPTMPKATYADAKQFLMDAMNHKDLPIAARADYAKALLPYQHARMGETGKKETAKDRARKIAGRRGAFRPKQPPLRLVSSKEE